MVVFMLNDSRNDPAEGFLLFFKVFIQIFNNDIGLAKHILANIGNAQTAFVKRPFIARFLNDFCIDKHFF